MGVCMYGLEHVPLYVSKSNDQTWNISKYIYTHLYSYHICRYVPIVVCMRFRYIMWLIPVIICENRLEGRGEGVRGGYTRGPAIHIAMDRERALRYYQR